MNPGQTTRTILAIIIVMMILCASAALGEPVPETYLQMSPVLSANLTEQDIEKIVLVSDRTNEYLGLRQIIYSYDGVEGISFTVSVRNGETTISGDESFVVSLRSYQSVSVGMEEAEAAAVSRFSEFLAGQEENPAYQAYIEHFSLDRITVSEFRFIPGFYALYGKDPVWIFRVYPVRANDGAEADDDREAPFPFLQWAVIGISGKTGEVTSFDTEDCFITRWEDLCTDEFIQEIGQILQRNPADFSMYQDISDAHEQEDKVLLEARALIRKGMPIERFCPGITHGEAVFKVFARFDLMMWEMTGYNFMKGVGDPEELSLYTDAMEYGRTHEPEICEKLFADISAGQ